MLFETNLASKIFMLVYKLTNLSKWLLNDNICFHFLHKLWFYF